MNFILGSGLVGVLAHRILGTQWSWIPFKRSRYYSWGVPYADNFVIYDDKITDIIKGITGQSTPVFRKRPFSYFGQLMYQELPIAVDPYLSKVYGDKIPTLAPRLLRTTYSTYNLKATDLYASLQTKSQDAINTGVKHFGELIAIDTTNHVITTKFDNNGVVESRKFEYDKIISTIPLSALNTYCKIDSKLPSRAVCTYYLVTDAVNLEGAEDALVSDAEIGFFKVHMLQKNHWMFWTFDAIENPHQFFGNILNYKIDIMEAKRIDEALPLGDPPDLGYLEKCGIYCVGSNAQWDDFMDVASCIKRLLSLSATSV